MTYIYATLKFPHLPLLCPTFLQCFERPICPTPAHIVAPISNCIIRFPHSFSCRRADAFERERRRQAKAKTPYEAGLYLPHSNDVEFMFRHMLSDPVTTQQLSATYAHDPRPQYNKA